jgi:DNA modification methylase
MNTTAAYLDDEWTTVHVGDCRRSLSLIPDQSVHCCVTSPPYWGLRDYGHPDQIGMEKTPEEYVAKIVEVFREVRRVLRDDGTLWLNLGDSYATGGGSVGKCPGGGDQGDRFLRAGMVATQPNRMPIQGLKPKDLVGIPWRVAFALQSDGWYLRQDIIWAKPNPMPESVRDRCTKAHEYIFLLSKRERYYYDSEAIKETAVCGNAPGKKSHKSTTAYDQGDEKHRTKKGLVAYANRVCESRAKGSFNGKTEAMADTGQNAFRSIVDKRNKRSVWTVGVRPYAGAHFATMPPMLAESCVLAGCPEGGFVLDPFGGSGTTAGVARKLFRKAIVFEINEEYARLMRQRIATISGDAPPFSQSETPTTEANP